MSGSRTPRSHSEADADVGQPLQISPRLKVPDSVVDCRRSWSAHQWRARSGVKLHYRQLHTHLREAAKVGGAAPVRPSERDAVPES